MDVSSIKRNLEHFLEERFEEHSRGFEGRLELLSEHARSSDDQLKSMDDQIRSMSQTLALMARATVPGFDDRELQTI